MTIKITTSNCDVKKPYAIEELADSSIEIQLGFERILSTQSRNKFIDELKSEIQGELQKFDWIICGKIQLEIHWYLDKVERQETDKVGDLDNISKPLIDSLSGFNGVLIDDSQINSIHSTWINKSALLTDNIVRIFIHFNNDYTLEKKNLYFLQTNQAMYTPLNFDLTDADNLKDIKLFMEVSKFKTAMASSFNSLNANVDSYLIYSEYKFHRTRLNGFDSKNIFIKEQFDQICKNKDINIDTILSSLNKASS
ncbi:MAG: hypothetical protein BGP13_21750 [Sphingobacteriales bacterium 40-81]|nr:MAG: hypothetical protein BGP13_21750 [Sphingobacteriales bacterium 40-81]